MLRSAALAYGRISRRRKARYALRLAHHISARSLLLVGVAGETNSFNNLIEKRLAEEIPFVVASGIVQSGGGWERFVMADGRALPFAAASFDLVYANAVVEHVGDLPDQRRFVEEIARVGRAWIITTPNRWFPIEAHHHTLFSHWGRRWAPKGSVTRLLGIRAFRSLLPYGRVRGVPVVSPTLTAVGRHVEARRGRGEAPPGASNVS